MRKIFSPRLAAFVLLGYYILSTITYFNVRNQNYTKEDYQKIFGSPIGFVREMVTYQDEAVVVSTSTNRVAKTVQQLNFSRDSWIAIWWLYTIMMIVIGIIFILIAGFGMGNPAPAPKKA